MNALEASTSHLGASARATEILRKTWPVEAPAFAPNTAPSEVLAKISREASRRSDLDSMW